MPSAGARVTVLSRRMHRIVRLDGTRGRFTSARAAAQSEPIGADRDRVRRAQGRRTPDGVLLVRTFFTFSRALAPLPPALTTATTNRAET